jgi:hypothetical protein
MTLGELAIEHPVPVGTRVFVQEDGIIYTGVGQTRIEIASRLGWTQPNIWIPEDAFQDISHEHDVYTSVSLAASSVLQHPLSVYKGRGPPFTSFVIEGDTLRDHGLLTSRSTQFVDAVVESRRSTGERMFLRLFHLSPATRNKGDMQLWP